VRPLLVIGEAEGGELDQQRGEVGRRRLLPEPAFQGLDEALDPYIVLGRAMRTDGAVAGEPDAMVALRCAADQPVAWHRQGVPAIAGHGAARLERGG
jgi:hypothetical protein